MLLETAFFAVEAIAELDSGGGVPVSGIAKGCRCSYRTAQRHVARLFSFGLIQSTLPAGEKARHWSLTEAGQGLLRAARP